MELTVISEGSAPRKEIKPDDVYMILAKEGLFVYIGKDCSVAEKRNALSNAHVSHSAVAQCFSHSGQSDSIRIGFFLCRNSCKPALIPSCLSLLSLMSRQNHSLRASGTSRKGCSLPYNQSITRKLCTTNVLLYLSFQIPLASLLFRSSFLFYPLQ